MNAERLLAHYERIADAADAIPRLRRFVLELAVRGKLTQQDSNDEPAAELLVRIATAKSPLVNDGKAKDKRALVAVTEDNVPFDVPAAWRWVRFANIADFSAGRTPSRNDPSFWNNGDHAWVSIADMEDGKVLATTKETVSDKARQLIFASEPVPPGTIIMSFKLTIGKIARLGVPAFHNEAIISIRPHLTDLDGYLFRVLPTFARQGNTKGAIKGATLNRDSISNILLPLPPVAEQRRIVAKLDELMALCDRLEAARAEREATRDRLTAATLAGLNAPDPKTFGDDARFALDALPRLTARRDQIKHLRQTILSLAVSGRLHQEAEGEHQLSIAGIVPEQENLLAIPVTWRWLQIDGLTRSFKGDVRTGPFGSALGKKDHRPSGVPVWGIESINKNGTFNGRNKIFISAEKAQELASFAVTGGDIIISRSGTVGELCRLPDDVPYGLISTNLMKISLDKTVISPDYFCLLFKGATSIDKQLTELCSGSTRIFLTQSILAKLLFPIPPLAEQAHIVAKINELMAVCDRLEASLATTDDARRRLLEALLAEALLPQHQHKLEAAE